MTIHTTALIDALDSTAAFLRGLALDPAVPDHSKEAITSRYQSIEALLADDEAKAEEDFLAGSKACDLSGEGACESCQ